MRFILDFAPIVVSIVALIVSIKSLNSQIPRLKVTIKKPQYDCFYGASKLVERGGTLLLSNYVAIVRFTLRNVSSSPLVVSDIELLCNGVSYEMAQKDNPYWHEVEIYFSDKYNINPEGNGFTTNGTYIDYAKEGRNLPLTIKPYGVETICAVFYSFPKSNLAALSAKLLLGTAKGNVKKKVTLLRYDADYETEDLDGFRKHLKSI